MDCFARIDKGKKLTDAQKGRIISLRRDSHLSFERIAELADTSVRISSSIPQIKCSVN